MFAAKSRAPAHRFVAPDNSPPRHLSPKCTASPASLSARTPLFALYPSYPPGDPLELSTQVTAVFVQGTEMPLSSRQSELRERYRELPRR